MTNWIEFIANIAAILTFVGATFAYVRYQWLLIEKRHRLEKYLKLGMPDNHIDLTERGRRTITHLSGKLRMTEAEILQAGFASKTIKSSLGVDKNTGRANSIFFQYGDPKLDSANYAE